jgi:O-antigen ligase
VSAAASLAGASAAVLQLAGALKTAPPLAALPFDLTLAALALLLPAVAVLAATRSWHVAPAVAVPAASALLLAFWLVVAGGWSASQAVLGRKLPEVALLGPAMLAAGLLVGAEAAARRAFCRTTLAIGLALAATVVLAVATGWRGPAWADADAARLQYQLAGLALAMAAALAATRAAEARSLRGAVLPLAAAALLALAALFPGGRTAMVALFLGLAAAPALSLWLGGRRGAALAWGGLVAVGAGLAAALLLLLPGLAEGLRTLERLAGDPAGLEARLHLWGAALAWAGEASPLGLGTGAFTIAAGFGERRGLYPHNHALEALAEAGLPGLLLWLGAFGGAAAVMLRRAPRVAPGRAARIAALVLPVGLTVMVSTDLGNRMAWFALGLALSLGVEARRPGMARGAAHV